jgi:hypothetical protein
MKTAADMAAIFVEQVSKSNLDARMADGTGIHRPTLAILVSPTRLRPPAPRDPSSWRLTGAIRVANTIEVGEVRPAIVVVIVQTVRAVFPGAARLIASLPSPLARLSRHNVVVNKQPATCPVHDLFCRR